MDKELICNRCYQLITKCDYEYCGWNNKSHLTTMFGHHQIIYHGWDEKKGTVHFCSKKCMYGHYGIHRTKAKWDNKGILTRPSVIDNRNEEYMKKGLCAMCGKSKDQWEKGRQKYCSQECANNAFTYWTSLTWKLIKKRGSKCEQCGQDDSKGLMVHHVVPYSEGGDFWDEDNLKVLCNECHKKQHTHEANKARRNKRIGQKTLG